jgi:hypothetical protein
MHARIATTDGGNRIMMPCTWTAPHGARCNPYILLEDSELDDREQCWMTKFSVVIRISAYQ